MLRIAERMEESERTDEGVFVVHVGNMAMASGMTDLTGFVWDFRLDFNTSDIFMGHFLGRYVRYT